MIRNTMKDCIQKAEKRFFQQKNGDKNGVYRKTSLDLTVFSPFTP